MKEYLSNLYADLQVLALQKADEYQHAQPFSHISLKNFFNPQMLDAVLTEFPDLTKGVVDKYDTPREKKFAGREGRFGGETKRFVQFLNSRPFLEFLQQLSGIKELLLPDPYFCGGGFHEVKKGGLVKVHADFSKHDQAGLDRRINVIVYLNKNWKEDYGGYLELWDTDMKACVKRILPEFNSVVIFSTTDYTFHGHPDPLTCPEGWSRKSLALYYYSNGRPAYEINRGLGKHYTIFKKREGSMADKLAMKYSYSLRQLRRDLVPPLFVKMARKVMNRF